MEVRILGSSRMLKPLKTDAVPTKFSDRRETPVRLSNVKGTEKGQRLEVCVCVVVSFFLAQLFSCDAWLVKKPTSLMFLEFFWLV